MMLCKIPRNNKKNHSNDRAPRSRWRTIIWSERESTNTTTELLMISVFPSSARSGPSRARPGQAGESPPPPPPLPYLGRRAGSVRSAITAFPSHGRQLHKRNAEKKIKLRGGDAGEGGRRRRSLQKQKHSGRGVMSGELTRLPLRACVPGCCGISSVPTHL